MANELETLIYEIQYKTKAPVKAIADKIGYSREHLTKLKKGIGNEKETTKIAALLRHEFAEILQPVTKDEPAAKEEKPQQAEMEVLVSIAKSNNTLAEAHKEIAASNRTLAKNNQELIALIKELVNARSQNDLIASPILDNVLGLLAENLVENKKFETTLEARAYINKRLFLQPQKGHKQDIQNG